MNGGDASTDRSANQTVSGTGGDGAEQTIEHQIETLREDIGEIVNELDRRRHEAFDLRLQVRRHRGALIAIGTVAIVAFTAYRSLRRRPEPSTERVRTLLHALALVGQDPDRLVRALEGKPQPETVATAALGKVAGVATRGLLGPRAA